MLSLSKLEEYWDTEECRDRIMAVTQADDPLEVLSDVQTNLYFEIYAPYIEDVLQYGGQPIFEEKDTTKKYYGVNDLAMMLGVGVLNAEQKFAEVPRHLNDVLRSWVFGHIVEQKNQEFEDKFIADHIDWKRVNQASSKEEREKLETVERLLAQGQLTQYYNATEKYPASVASAGTLRKYSAEQQALLNEYLEQHHRINEKGEKGVAFYCLEQDEFERHFIIYYYFLAHENVNRILNPCLYKPGTRVIKQSELDEENENGKPKWSSYYLQRRDFNKDLERNEKRSSSDENWFMALSIFNHDEEVKQLMNEYRESGPARQKTLWYRVLVELSRARGEWWPTAHITWNNSKEIDEFLRVVYGK